MNIMHMSSQRDLMNRARQKAESRDRAEIAGRFDQAQGQSMQGNQGQGSLINAIGVEYAKAFEVASRGLMP